MIAVFVAANENAGGGGEHLAAAGRCRAPRGPVDSAPIPPPGASPQIAQVYDELGKVVDGRGKDSRGAAKVLDVRTKELEKVVDVRKQRALCAHRPRHRSGRGRARARRGGTAPGGRREPASFRRRGDSRLIREMTSAIREMAQHVEAAHLQRRRVELLDPGDDRHQRRGGENVGELAGSSARDREQHSRRWLIRWRASTRSSRAGSSAVSESASTFWPPL